MQNPIKFIYTFEFQDGGANRFEIRLQRETLTLIADEREDLPAWTKMKFQRCSNCPLKKRQNKHCPVAKNLVGIVEKFADLLSHEKARVTVETEERTYRKDTTVHAGLSSMLGIVMTTSGCPVMEPLKPMVRFHLPFASIEETIFRMTSMYLLAQYLKKQAGLPFDRDLNGLAQIYSDVSKANKDFSQRLAQAAEKDANVNALVELDVFASMVQLLAEDAIGELKPCYSAYLK
jgi:hypothetical protein